MFQRLSEWLKGISPEVLKIRVTIAAVAALCVWILFTLVKLQITDHEKYLFEAKRQQFGTIPFKPERGNIYDRDNNLLAYNSADYTVQFNYRGLTQKTINEVIRKICSVTHKDSSYYHNKLLLGKYEAVLEKKITGQTVLDLKNLDLRFIRIINEPTRVYHYGKLASHVLGYVDRKTLKGLDGIENSFEKILAGIDGVQSVEKNSTGSVASVIEELTISPVSGKNVILTIDQNVQKAVEEVMTIGIAANLKSTTIVMNPSTGEILAFYNSDAYDPNSFSLDEKQSRKNSGVTDIYEPGSTFKGITFASLIERGKINDFTEVIETENGVYSPYKGIIIRDVHKFPYLSVADVFAKSSNIGTIKLIQRISNEDFYEDLRKVGFGSKTNIQLPAETKGRLSKPSTWSRVSKSSIAYGYEIGVSPIQLITAYASIINGGILYEPRIVKSITNEDGSVDEVFPAKEIRRAYSPATSLTMRNLLVRAVVKGTGHKAKIDGITIGGKTGTSRTMVGGNYTKDKYNSSFVGFFPAENPRYIVLVVLETPVSELYSGGDLAAPLFKEIALKIIEKNSEMLEQPAEPNSEKTNEVEFTFAKNEAKVEYIPMKESTSVKVRKTIMPDLTGLSVRDAVKLCGEMKLKFQISGHGRIIRQSITAESVIKAGQLLIIEGSHQFGESE